MRRCECRSSRTRSSGACLHSEGVSLEMKLTGEVCGALARAVGVGFVEMGRQVDVMRCEGQS